MCYVLFLLSMFCCEFLPWCCTARKVDQASTVAARGSHLLKLDQRICGPRLRSRPGLRVAWPGLLIFWLGPAWPVFMPLPNVVWLEAYWFVLFVHRCLHPSVHASVCASLSINTISGRVFDTLSPNLHQWCSMGWRWTLHSLGSNGERSRSLWNEVCWKQQFLGLLTRCLEKY